MAFGVGNRVAESNELDNESDLSMTFSEEYYCEQQKKDNTEEKEEGEEKRIT